MFKSLNILATAAIVSLSSVSIAGEDDLFSDFSARSVFSDTAEPSSGGSRNSSASKRITNAEDLRELLKAGGFEAKAVGSRTATSEKKLEPWTFPMLAVLSEDETTVTVVLGLASIKDVSKELNTDKLLKMMNISQNNAPMMFVYNADRERTEVSITMPNLKVTGQMLREQINNMAVIAKNNADMWKNEQQSTETRTSANPQTSTTPAAPQEPTTPGVPTTSLQGKWTAARSQKEAFGVEFKTDGTFSLVYINNGQQSKSAGQFTIQAGFLKLNGNDGMKLEGKLTMTSATEFRFEPANSTAMTFKKAD